MPIEIRVPQLGESVVEASVSRWLKKEGETVSQGEPLVELETEKVSVEVAAEAAGTLTRVTSPEGSTVHVGDLLGEIGDGAKGTAPTAPARADREGPAAEARPPSPDGNRQKASSPLARHLAQEHSIDLAEVEGTGPGGRIMREDVLSHLAERGRAESAGVAPAPAPAQSAAAPRTAPQAATPPAPAATPPTPARPEERVRMSRRRQTIARRLVEAQQTAAMLTTFNEIDMTAVMDLRKRRRDAFQERHGVGLGFMSFFTRAVVGALKSFPRLNAEIQGDEMVLKRYYDIGVAVDAEGGLVVPVVRDADRKSFAEIERAVGDLARRARENQLSLADLQGGTFTITNGGIFGSLLSTPILNTPQVGILGMHRIQERPVAVNGQVIIRPMMYVALTYDHRIVDGREAVQFLVRVKELLEDPEALLLEG